MLILVIEYNVYIYNRLVRTKSTLTERREVYEIHVMLILLFDRCLIILVSLK